mgnify:CR=1 FL=1
MINTKSNLVNLLRSMHEVDDKKMRLEEAEDLQRAVAIWRKRHLGENNPDTMDAGISLAMIRHDLGKEDAVGLLKEMLALQQELLSIFGARDLLVSAAACPQQRVCNQHDDEAPLTKEHAKNAVRW